MTSSTESFKALTDKQLLDGMDKGCLKSLNELRARYNPRIRYIYENKFSIIQGILKYSKNGLYKDIESSVWLSFHDKRNKKELYYTGNDSIGAFMHVIADALIKDKVIQSINHRSDDSTAVRMAKKKAMEAGIEVEPSKLLHHGDFDLSMVVDESYEDDEEDIFEILGVNEDFLEVLPSVLTSTELKLYELKKNKKRADICAEMRITVDQYKRVWNKIKLKAELVRLREKNSSN